MTVNTRPPLVYVESPFRFNPSRRFLFDHKVAIDPEDLEQVPEQFRGISPPDVGSEALCCIEKDRPVGQLEMLRPFIHDLVQLSFLVPTPPGPWFPSFQVGCELMWVSVVECDGTWPNTIYRGVLHNIPVFVSPDRLQIGSTVTFDMQAVVKNLYMEMTSNLTDHVFLSVMKDNQPWLTVKSCTGRPAYPLTPEGIHKAGRDLYDSGKKDWFYSSSVDFPEDYDSDCDLDIRTLLENSYVERAEEVGDSRFSKVRTGFTGAFSRFVEDVKLKGDNLQAARNISYIPFGGTRTMPSPTGSGS